MFLHKVIAGSADKSYGVHVARLAGLPQQVTRRAAQLVTQLKNMQNLKILCRTACHYLHNMTPALMIPPHPRHIIRLTGLTMMIESLN